MTSLLTRRRMLRGTLAAAGLGLLAPATGRAATRSAPQDNSPLPTVGQSIGCSLKAFGATLAVALPPPMPKLDFTGSRTVEIEPGGTDFVRYRVVHLHITAQHPFFGEITCRAPEDGDTGSGTLRISGSQLTETWTQPMQVTFARCGDTPGPYQFTTLEPARWTAELTQFPPPADPDNGASYTLQQPFYLGLTPQQRTGTDADNCPLATPLPDAPDGAYAGFLDFPITQAGLS